MRPVPWTCSARRPKRVGDDWTVETTLTATTVDGAGFGRYAARDYWDAIDHPVQWAAHRGVGFAVAASRTASLSAAG